MKRILIYCRKQIVKRAGFNLLAAIVGCLFLYGCPTPVPHGVKTTHFVTEYLYVAHYNTIQYNENTMLLTYLTNTEKKITEREDKEAYEALCTKHNDIDFFCKEVSLGCSVINQDISALSIKTKSAYDDEHPSGSDIGDITTLFTTTIAPFIESGYQNLYPASEVDYNAFPFNLFYSKYGWPYGIGYNFSDKTNYPNHVISKKIKELSFPLVMIGSFPQKSRSIAAIIFDKAPKTPGAYEFEMNIKTTEGKEYNLNCKMNFN